jgi:hypothetical protein
MSRYKLRDHEGLQTVPPYNVPEIHDIHPPERDLVPETAEMNGHQRQYWYEHKYSACEKLVSGIIYGLRKPTFLLVVLLGLAVNAAAVIGGVLGSQKSKSSR